MPLGAQICLRKGKVCQDRISALPDHLLVQILCQAPTRDAVTTMILSKRWRFVWTMMPKLDYSELYQVNQSVRYLLNNSLQLHKAPVLESLAIHLGYKCPDDADVGKWVSDAVVRRVRELKLELHYSHPRILPACLYTCKSLVKLTLSNRILVDVPFLPCLPSLQSLDLTFVMYKDQVSHVRLLSSCPVLRDLCVVRVEHDNVTSFSVKVPTLQKLTYMDSYSGGSDRSLVIECPGLRYVKIHDPLGDNFSIHNMPRLDVAFVNVVSRFGSHKNNKFLRSFSSVMFLNLTLTKLQVACCSTIYFPRLREFKLCPDYLDYYWLESLMLLLHNSPKLKVLMINSESSGYLPLSWNQPSSVPVCLLSHLEIFEWRAYRGAREEKQFVAYILANSRCLKTVGVSPRPFDIRNDNSIGKKQEMMEELESMHWVSASSQLVFSAPLRWRYRE